MLSKTIIWREISLSNSNQGYSFHRGVPRATFQGFRHAFVTALKSWLQGGLAPKPFVHLQKAGTSRRKRRILSATEEGKVALDRLAKRSIYGSTFKFWRTFCFTSEIGVYASVLKGVTLYNRVLSGINFSEGICLIIVQQFTGFWCSNYTSAGGLGGKIEA